MENPAGTWTSQALRLGLPQKPMENWRRFCHETMGGLTQENDGKHIQQSQGCGFEEC